MPTAALLRAAGDNHALAAQTWSAACDLVLWKEVVARDGIEPPTPAFLRAAGDNAALPRRLGARLAI